MAKKMFSVLLAGEVEMQVQDAVKREIDRVLKLTGYAPNRCAVISKMLLFASKNMELENA